MKFLNVLPKNELTQTRMGMSLFSFLVESK